MDGGHPKRCPPLCNFHKIKEEVVFTKKKLFGLLFAICILVGLLTATALAEEVEYSDTAYVKVGPHELTLEDGVPQYFKPKSTTNFYPSIGNIDNYTTIVEYDAEANKVTVTLEGSLAGNDKDSSQAAKRNPAFTFGNDTNKNFDVDIIVKGACVLSSYKGQNIIVSNTTGTLTFKDTGATDDQLTLYRSGGSTDIYLVDAAGGAVVFNETKVNVRETGTGAGLFNVASLTINDSDVNMFSTSKASVFSSGDVLIEDSNATFAASASSGIGTPLVNVTGEESTITIKNSTVIGGTTAAYATRPVFNKAPVLDFSATNNVYEFAGSNSKPTITAATETTDAVIDPGEISLSTTYTTYTEGSNGYRYFSIRPCAHEGDLVDTDKDCTTGLQCPACGTVVGTEFNTNHTDPGQTNCEEEVTCSTPGCEVVLHEAGSHTPADSDDGDCETPVMCTNCQEPAFAAQTHTYTDDSDTSCDNLLSDGTTCTHTRKLIYIELVDQELVLTDGEPVYYKVDANNYPVTATVDDATIIISYSEANNKVTVRLLNGVTICAKNDTNCLTFGKDGCNDFAVDIVIDGACTLDSTSAYPPLAIESNITGDLTITDTGEADDSLFIQDKANSAGTDFSAVYITGNLVIDSAKVTVWNTSRYYGSAIIAKNVTIQNSTVTLYSASKYNISATGNVLVKNSTLTLSSPYSTNSLVNVTDENTITIDNSTVIAGVDTNGGSIFSENPTLTYNGYVFSGSTSRPTVSTESKGDIDASELTLVTTYTAGTNYKYFNIAPCTHENTVVQDNDCTKDQQCVVCGNTVAGTANTGHTDPGQTNCTVAVTCSNPGCEVVLHEATEHTGGTATCTSQKQCTKCNTFYGELAAHTPEDDDGNCTTDILCALCREVATPGAPAHTYDDNTDTTCNNAGCTHIRKLAYVKLVKTELTLADGQTAYYKVNDGETKYVMSATDENDATIIVSYSEANNKVTVTLKGVTIHNKTKQGTADTILTFGNDTYKGFDADIVIDGACTLDSSISGYTSLAIESYITGVLTIKDTGEADDSLTIIDKSNSSTADAVYIAETLVIDGVKVAAKNPSDSGGSVITAKNVTIQNSSDVTLFSDSQYAINATGDVLIKDSRLTMSSNGSIKPLISVGENNTITVDNSTIIAGVTTTGGSIFSKAPILTYNGYVFAGSTEKPTVTNPTATEHAVIDASAITLENTYTAGIDYKYFNIAPCTHAPEAEWEDIDQDCTTGLQCPTCGAVLGEAEFTEHITNSSLTDCTLGLHCERDGCTGYVIEPKEDHTWNDELNECNVCHMPRALTPSYIITIPASITTSNGAPVTVNFGAQAIENLAAGDSIRVSVAGGLDNNGKIKLELQDLELQDNETITILSQMSIDGVIVNNPTPEIVSFATNGDHSEEVPIAFAIPENTQYAGTYTGTITFSVSWVQQGGNAE